LDKQSSFIDGLNCLVVETPEQLKEVMNTKNIEQTARIGSYFIMPHTAVDWEHELFSND
jgi:hypothetical protein